MKEKKYCHTCKQEKTRDKSNFYWDSTNGKWESQCKNCRKRKLALQKRKVYDPVKARKRYLLRKKRGELKDSWKKWRYKYPEKYKARYTLRNAVKLGKIEKGKCEIGRDCKGRLEAHHEDYTKPLEVRWVCQKHHKIIHHDHTEEVKNELKAT